MKSYDDPTTLSDAHLGAIREKCKRSFFFFLQVFWREIIPETPVYNWHIKYLCDQLQQVAMRVVRREPKLYDLVINVPPGTSKSTICTVMLPVWIWTHDARIRTLTASYAQSLSTDHSVKSRDILRSDMFNLLFPDLTLRADFDNKNHYKNNFGGERMATSVTGRITGFHGHVLIVDDPLNPKEAVSEAERLTANEFMSQTLSTRKVDKDITPTILIMQRLHQEDPTGKILEDRPDTVRHICLPGEMDTTLNPPDVANFYVDGLLDPVRLKRDTLDEMRKTLGSYGYAGQFLQRPAPPEGGIWKKWFVGVEPYEMPLIQDTRENQVAPPNRRLPVIKKLGTDWDLAYTEKETNSASAYVTAGVHDGKMYIYDLGYKYLEFPQLIEFMAKRQAPHYIEAKASGKSAKQTLVNRGIPAKEVNVKGGDKVARAMLATPYAEAGIIYVQKSLLKMLYDDPKQGVLLFPNGAADDLQDALVQAINRCLATREVLIF